MNATPTEGQVYTLEKRLPKDYQDSINTYADFVVDTYKMAKLAQNNMLEHSVYSDILSECFHRQNQSYMKNCREFALEYLNMLQFSQKKGV